MRESRLRSAKCLRHIVPVDNRFKFGWNGAYTELLRGVVDESLVQFPVVFHSLLSVAPRFISSQLSYHLNKIINIILDKL